jgi:hypothetical protein
VKQLTTSADRERKEAEAARELSAHLQRERDEAQDALTQLSATLKEKERLAFQVNGIIFGPFHKLLLLLAPPHSVNHFNI